MKIKGEVFINGQDKGHNTITDYGISAVLESLLNNGVKLTHIALRGDLSEGKEVCYLLRTNVKLKDKNSLLVEALCTQADSNWMVEGQLTNIGEILRISEVKKIYLLFNQLPSLSGFITKFDKTKVFAEKDIESKDGQVLKDKSKTYQWKISISR